MFCDYTLAFDGSISSRFHHRSELLDRSRVEMFKNILRSSVESFRKIVPADASRDLEVSWSPEGQAALAAFSLGGVMVTISALLTGRNEQDDNRILHYFREILAEEARPRELPAPHLAEIADRPLVLSIPLPASRPEAMSLVGEMEVCLAAAFFEGHE